MQGVVRPKVVFLGDSITEGKIGASYVERVRAQLGANAEVINAGINGDTVVNMRWRVTRDVAPHNPQLVVVMAGLNDLGTVYALPLQRAYYRLLKGNLINLTVYRFGLAYRALVHKLRRFTRAQIILCTPTTLTEQPAATVQTLIDAYTAVVWTIADQEQLPVIDVRSACLQAITSDPRPGPDYHISIAVGDMLAVRQGKTTYAELTAQRGYRLLCDGAHLADAGADLVAEVVTPQVRAAIADWVAS